MSRDAPATLGIRCAEVEDVLSQSCQDTKGRTTWKCIPISVYQVRQWLNSVFLFFRGFRVVRG